MSETGNHSIVRFCFIGLLVFAAPMLALAGCGGNESASTPATTATETTTHATPNAKDLIARSSDFPDGYTVAGDATGASRASASIAEARCGDQGGAPRRL